MRNGRLHGTVCRNISRVVQHSEGKVENRIDPIIGGTNIVSKGFEDPGALTSTAAKVLMNILYVARVVRFGLLQPVTALAREVSRWNKAFDKKLFRLVSYINSTLTASLVSHLGDPTNE